MDHPNPTQAGSETEHLDAKPTRLLILRLLTSKTFPAAIGLCQVQFWSSAETRLREAVEVRGNSQCTCRSSRWGILTRQIDAPTTTEGGRPDADPEDELPTLEELLFGQPSLNKEADVIPASKHQIVHGSTRAAADHEDGAASGERGEEDVGVMMEAITFDTVDAILTPTSMATTESGDLPRPGTALRSLPASTTPLADCVFPEDGNGSGGDDGSVKGTDLPHAQQRKRTRPLSADLTMYDLGAPDLGPDLDPEMHREDPRLSKRQKLPPHTADESTSIYTLPTASSNDSKECSAPALLHHAKRARSCEDDAAYTRRAIRSAAPSPEPTPNPNPDLSLSSATGPGETHDGVDNEQSGTERQSPAAEPASVSSLQPHRPALTAARDGAACLKSQSHDEARSTQYPSPKVTEMFVAVTIQTAGDMLQISLDDPAKLIESASAYAGRAEDVTIKPLCSAGTWELSGRLRLSNVCGSGVALGPLARREPTLAGGGPSCDFRKRAQALCDGAGYGAEVGCVTGAKGDGIVNDCHRRSRNGGNGDGSDNSGDGDDDEYDDDEYEVARRRNQRWDPLDDRRLLAWRQENKSWEWIAGQLRRTKGAVYLRWYNLLKRSGQ